MDDDDYERERELDKRFEDDRCAQTLAAIDRDHRCPACNLAGALQRMTAERDLLARERTRLADELIETSRKLSLALEQRDIAIRRAARAVADKDAMLDRELERERVQDEQRESLRQAEYLVAQLRMVQP